MSTRLDRLFVLLDTGSTPLIRRSAAEQLGDVVHLHPHELSNLLNKVHGYLKSTSWDTRVAASQAVEAIAKKVPQWNPPGLIVKSEVPQPVLTINGMVLFSNFNIHHVLSCGASLLASEGNQFDVEQGGLGMDDKEQLLHQRQLLNKRLGLDAVGFDSTALFNDEDLKNHVASTNNNSKPVGEVLAQQLPKTEFPMSNRERNAAKRRARSLSKQFISNPGSEEVPPLKRIKRERSDGSLDSTDSSIGEEGEEWPFLSFCEVLMNDLFHPSWEVRHGAGSGLREVIKHHGEGAGKNMDMPTSQLHLANQMWLSDLALRLLCVLALDRFGDFVSDEVVAPVRETCAQALGTVLKYMGNDTVSAVVNVSLQLLTRPEWEIRHGALLNLKYSLAVRQDMTSFLLPVVLPATVHGLRDPDDDVRAVAAAALLPVTDALVEFVPAQIPAILMCLWDILCDLDDLTASTNSIMSLLAKLTALSSHNLISKELIFKEMSLTSLTPRLWPFLRHNIFSVRKAALETFQTLLKVHDAQTTSQWLLPIYQDAIRHIYQRCILEVRADLLPVIVVTWELLLERGIQGHLIAISMPWVGVWLAFLMQPAHMAFDSSLLIETKHKPRDITTLKAKAQAVARPVVPESKYYIGGLDSMQYSSSSDSDASINRARIFGSKLFGMLTERLCQPLLAPVQPEMEPPLVTLGKLLSFHLNGKSSLQRFIVGHVIYSWATLCKKDTCPCPENTRSLLLSCIEEPILYDEMAFAFTRLQTDCRDFLASLKLQGIDLDAHFPPGQLLTVETSLQLTSQAYPQVRARLKTPVQVKFDERSKQLETFTTQTEKDQQQHHFRVRCSLAMALVALGTLPDKLNPVVRPLMDVIKKEENTMLQEEAATCLAQLIRVCQTRTPSPNAKVIKNLCNFLCSDPTVTPVVNSPLPHMAGSQGPDLQVACSVHEGILTLGKLQTVSDKNVRRKPRRSSNVPKNETKGESTPASSQSLLDSDLDKEQAETIAVQKQMSIQRQGAEMALAVITRAFNKDLPSILPILWDVCVNGPSTSDATSEGSSSEVSMDASQTQELVNTLQTIEVIIPALHSDLFPTLLKHLDQLKILLSNKWTAVRHMSGRVLASLSQKSNMTQVLTFVVKAVLPLLEAMTDDRMREGATEAVSIIVDRLGMDCLPYLVVLIIPILGRMSDQNLSVRMMATHCFATLIRLMPLEAGVPDPSNMEEWLIERKKKERKFLDQLLDMSKLDDYLITVPIQAELRKYQQDGVNWLGFLNKYKLHGILCDDMGLGKTLQSICILASDHLEREKQYKSSGNSPELKPLPSIVVCPPTLVGHWVYEVNKFIDSDYLNPLMYAGPPVERTRLQKLVKNHNLIVASYEVVRNDLDFFGKIKWNYCILDEGHIIRNGKTKLAKAVKSLTSNYRLILSGTPIQNNVLDLWSLFDFLMPGFMGTERQFMARFGKPIIQSRDAKSTSKEQEAGSLAMEALHRQVLPFVLRRLKDDVLKDLPPKIMQDYFSDLSPLQVELYEDFAKSRARQGVDETVTGEEKDKDIKSSAAHGTTHVFQALQYLRKLCNHPALVMNKSHPRYSEIVSRLTTCNSSLKDLSHAPKLTALRQLLYDCGIGLAPNSSGGSSANDQAGLDAAPVVNQHRVLLFCQLKSMLDIVEHDLLKVNMPNVSYLRLDGTVPAGGRHDIVRRFNSDPSIDILLLTTHVGGLGLNLTGADTVIFVEHDWNPMKDLQAMDRAHRIGQKKVVNVYRLITRGTLEEKIMNLQKFKMAVANTIINQDNSSLHTMGTDQLLDLFVLDQTNKGSLKDGQSADKKSNGAATKGNSVKSILEGLDELWDESQYENEYDVEAFMKSLGKVKK